MKKLLILLIVASFISVGCLPKKPAINQNINQPAAETDLTNESAGLANPASVNCEEKGGKLKIKTDSSGNQYGLCKFTDGSECEEWAYFRGECAPGQTVDQVIQELFAKKYNKVLSG